MVHNISNFSALNRELFLCSARLVFCRSTYLSGHWMSTKKWAHVRIRLLWYVRRPSNRYINAFIQSTNSWAILLLLVLPLGTPTRAKHDRNTWLCKCPIVRLNCIYFSSCRLAVSPRHPFTHLWAIYTSTRCDGKPENRRSGPHDKRRWIYRLMLSIRWDRRRVGRLWWSRPTLEAKLIKWGWDRCLS